MTDEQQQERGPSLAEILGSYPIFVRLQAAQLVEKVLGPWADHVESTREIAEAIHNAYTDGERSGRTNALYDTPPDVPFGEVVYMHKVLDLRILELIYEGQTVFTAQAESGHYGTLHTEFDAALVDAIGYKHSSADDDPGGYAIRVLCIPTGRVEQ